MLAASSNTDRTLDPIASFAGRQTADTSSTIKQPTTAKSTWSLARKPPPSKILLTLNQISVMTNNGVEVADALQSASQNCGHLGLSDALQKIHYSVAAGSSLAIAFEQHGVGFPSSMPAVLAAAEASGSVPESISRVVEQMRAQLQIKATLTGALIYPVILTAVSLFVMSALVLGVLPQFREVFASLGKPVPTSTAYLLATGDIVRNHFIWIALFGSLGIVAMWKCRTTTALRKPIFQFLLHAPVIRNAYRPLVTGHVFRTMASMILGGVPLLDSVRLTRRATVDPAWNDLLGDMENHLIDGKSPSSVLAHSTFLPPEAAQMMSTGERTGRVGEVLEDIGGYYEEEAIRNLKRLIVAIEPAIILVMGLMVAGIVLSVMLPMLDITTV